MSDNLPHTASVSRPDPGHNADRLHSRGTERQASDRSPVYVSHLAPILAAADAQRDRAVAAFAVLASDAGWLMQRPEAAIGLSGIVCTPDVDDNEIPIGEDAMRRAYDAVREAGPGATLGWTDGLVDAYAEAEAQLRTGGPRVR